MKLECKMCGKCCKELGQDIMLVIAGDVARWIDERREDILGYVEMCRTKEELKCWWVVEKNDFKQCPDCIGGDLINPDDDSYDCLFILDLGDGNYTCEIHETKPDMCHKWPVGKHVNCPLHEEWLKTNK